MRYAFLIRRRIQLCQNQINTIKTPQETVELKTKFFMGRKRWIIQSFLIKEER